MSFSEQDYIWADDNLKCVWQDDNNRFYVKQIVFKPKNYFFIDVKHEQYIVFLAEDINDAIGVAEKLAGVLNGR